MSFVFIRFYYFRNGVSAQFRVFHGPMGSRYRSNRVHALHLHQYGIGIR